MWYSTDYVFDGGVKSAKGPYAESDATSPLNIYGSSKLAGEKAVMEADPSALVLRTNVVFGPGARRVERSGGGRCRVGGTCWCRLER